MYDQAIQGTLCEACQTPLGGCRCFTAGDRVRFREAIDPGDESSVFDVVEDNGDRIMIQLVCDLPIRPVTVVDRADMCCVSRR